MQRAFRVIICLLLQPDTIKMNLMNRVDMMYVLSDQSVHMQGPVVQSPLA